MALDVIEIHGTGDSINLVKITKVTVQAGVISDPADVAFEMTIVNRVEANQRDEKPPVRFERRIPEQIAAGGQSRIQLIERLKERIDSLFVRRLGGRKPCSIDSIVDRLVNQLIEPINVRSILLRIEIQVAISIRVEFTVQNPHEIVIGIIDDHS